MTHSETVRMNQCFPVVTTIISLMASVFLSTHSRAVVSDPAAKEKLLRLIQQQKQQSQENQNRKPEEMSFTDDPNEQIRQMVKFSKDAYGQQLTQEEINKLQQEQAEDKRKFDEKYANFHRKYETWKSALDNRLPSSERYNWQEPTEKTHNLDEGQPARGGVI